MMNNDYFTVTFFPEEHRKDLAILGSKSGRDGDKVAQTSLTPVALEHGVGFEEASLTFVCKKLYWNIMDLEKIVEPDIVNGIYATRPAHYEYIGEIVDVIEK